MLWHASERCFRSAPNTNVLWQTLLTEESQRCKLFIGVTFIGLSCDFSKMLQIVSFTRGSTQRWWRTEGERHEWRAGSVPNVFRVNFKFHLKYVFSNRDCRSKLLQARSEEQETLGGYQGEGCGTQRAGKRKNTVVASGV